MAETDVEKENEVGRESDFTLLQDLSDEEREKLLTLTKDRLDASEKFMQTLYPQMIANYKKYSSVADEVLDELGNVDSTRANLFVPYPHAIVESELPRLAGKLPRARAFPRKDVDARKVEAIQDLIYYGLDRMNWLQTQTLMLRQHAIYGWCPVYYYWRHEKREVLERIPIVMPDGGKTWSIRRVEKIVWDDFWADVLDVFDCFLQPGVESIENSDWFMFREWYSAKDLKKMVEAEILYPEVLEYLEERGDKPSFKMVTTDGKMERDDIKGLADEVSDHAYGKFELMWCLEDDRVIQVLDRAVIARVGDNPNPLQVKPIINCVLMPLVSEPIGVGTVEELAGLPDKLNALTNARLDNIGQIVNKVFLADRNSATDFANLKSTRGNVILTDDIDRSIKELQMTDIGQSSEREIRNTKEEMQFVSGVSDYLVGTNTSSRLSDTATGVSTIVREANAKFALKLATLESGVLRQIIYAMHAYMMTYMPDEKRIFVLGPKGAVLRNITIDDILFECDFIIEPGSCVPLDQVTRRQALAQLLDRVMKIPQIVKLPKFLRDVLDSYDIRNPEEYLISGEGPLSLTEDIETAKAENISLAGMDDVPLVGDDQLHASIHMQPIQSGEWDKWPEGAKLMLVDHITAHKANLMAKQAAMGGQLGQAGMGGPQGSPVAPNMAGPAGLAGMGGAQLPPNNQIG